LTLIIVVICGSTVRSCNVWVRRAVAGFIVRSYGKKCVISSLKRCYRVTTALHGDSTEERHLKEDI